MTELPELPITKQDLSLQGKPANTESALTRLMFDVEALWPIDEGPAKTIGEADGG